MIWLVTRHPGAIEWAAQHGLRWDRAVAHLDVEDVHPGDDVYGSVPAQLAARLCERGARYWHLSVGHVESTRGVELTADELRSLGACFVRLHVQVLTR